MKISSMRSCLQISLELSRYARHDPLRLLKVKLCKLDTSYSLACVISTNFQTHLNPSVKFLSDKKRISNSGLFPPLFWLIWHLISEKIICTKLISFQFGTIFQYLSRLISMYNIYCIFRLSMDHLTGLPISNGDMGSQGESSGRSTPNSDSAPGKLFVGGLSWQTSQDKLREYFGQFGNVTDVLVMKDPITQVSGNLEKG